VLSSRPSLPAVMSFGRTKLKLACPPLAVLRHGTFRSWRCDAGCEPCRPRIDVEDARVETGAGKGTKAETIAMVCRAWIPRVEADEDEGALQFAAAWAGRRPSPTDSACWDHKKISCCVDTHGVDQLPARHPLEAAASICCWHNPAQLAQHASSRGRTQQLERRGASASRRPTQIVARRAAWLFVCS
jgi:hypothetical protein